MIPPYNEQVALHKIIIVATTIVYSRVLTSFNCSSVFEKENIIVYKTFLVINEHFLMATPI